MASPIAKDVWASTPKIWRTFFALRYSTRASARFVSAIVASSDGKKFGVLEYRSAGVLGLNASLHYSTTPVPTLGLFQAAVKSNIAKRK
jgi:hypothetical protein